MNHKHISGTLLFKLLFMLSATLLLLAAISITLAIGLFADSGQMLGGDTTFDVALADLDGDNDADAFAANQTGNRVWINQGGDQGGDTGIFQKNNDSPGFLESRGVALADVDNNQTIDAFVANVGDNQVWKNDGSGGFTLGQTLMSDNGNGRDVALGKLDADELPDAFVANNGPNEVWLNDGSGNFNLAQDDLGSGSSLAVVLGDVDSNGTLDAYVTNGAAGSHMDELWLNNGLGQFTNSGQSLDLEWNEGAAFADLDGDDDLDLFLATWFGTDGVWINQGGDQGGTEGTFSDSGQNLSGSSSTDVALIDLDNDNDPDAVVSKWLLPNEVWENNGSGQFTNTGQTLDDAATYAVAAGDLDQDDDPDLFFGNFGVNSVWMLGGLGLPTAWFDVDTRSNQQGQQVYPWSQPGDAILPVLLGFAAPQQLDVKAQIESDGGNSEQTISFDIGETTNELTIANPGADPSTTVTITLSVNAATFFTEHFRPDHINPLQLIFVDGQQGPAGCVLCMVDWILKLAGFEPSFWMLHHVQIADLQDSPSWTYYDSLFEGNEAELTGLVMTHPTLLWEMYEVLQVWTPGVLALEAGDGDNSIITPEMVGETQHLLDGLGDEGSAKLAADIERERMAVGLDDWAGQSASQLAEKAKRRIDGLIYLPVTTQQR